MADRKAIQVQDGLGNLYDIKDAKAQEDIAELKSALDVDTDYIYQYTGKKKDTASVATSWTHKTILSDLNLLAGITYNIEFTVPSALSYNVPVYLRSSANVTLADGQIVSGATSRTLVYTPQENMTGCKATFQVGTATGTTVTAELFTNAAVIPTILADLEQTNKDVRNPEKLADAKLICNLINPYSNIVDNRYINTNTGDLASSSNYRTSDYIPVIAGCYYYSGDVSHYAFYNSDKEYIDGSGSGSVLRTTAPVNAAYVRVDWLKTKDSSVYLNIGRFPKMSNAFGVVYPWFESTKKINSERLNQYGAYYTNLFNKYTADDGHYVDHTTGSIQSSGTYFVSDLIEVKPSTTYVMSTGNRYAEYNENLQYVTGGNLSGSNKEFTTNSGTKYVRISNTPLTLKDTLVLAEKAHFSESGEPFGIYVPWIVSAKSKYHGKNMVCFGDSITAMGYTGTIIRDTGINAINVGLSSGRYAYSDDSNQYINAFAFHNIVDAIISGDWTIPDSINGVSGYEGQYANIQKMKTIDFSTIDFISIAYGTNDFSSATPMDNPSNPYDTNYFKGAMRYCIKKLMEKYPNLKVLISTPFYRFWTSSGEVVDDCDTHTIGGFLLKDYTEAEIEVCTELHLPYVDNLTYSGVNSYNRLQYFSISDPLHPNDKGRAMIGHKIADGVLGNY